MTKTTMELLERGKERKGFSKHTAHLFLNADHEGVMTLSIHGPGTDGNIMILPWDDILKEAMQFYEK